MMGRKLLADMVKEERLRRNLSQNALAEQACVSLRTISDIECCKGNPRFDTLCALASYLNISIDLVIHGEQEADSTVRQIMAQLSQCSDASKHVALSTLNGLLSGLEDIQQN